ncbi:hypothetical protein MRX96_044081 [Rhipicephalus microplus]
MSFHHPSQGQHVLVISGSLVHFGTSLEVLNDSLDGMVCAIVSRGRRVPNCGSMRPYRLPQNKADYAQARPDGTSQIV